MLEYEDKLLHGETGKVANSDYDFNSSLNLFTFYTVKH